MIGFMKLGFSKVSGLDRGTASLGTSEGGTLTFEGDLGFLRWT